MSPWVICKICGWNVVDINPAIFSNWVSERVSRAGLSPTASSVSIPAADIDSSKELVSVSVIGPVIILFFFISIEYSGEESSRFFEFELETVDVDELML